MLKRISGALIGLLLMGVIALSFPPQPIVRAQIATPTLIPPGPTLNTVQSRGQLSCGVNQSLPGFGFINPNTQSSEGFDVDFCRALAAALLGDPLAVELVELDDVEAARSALRSGRVDIVMRNLVVSLTGGLDGLEYGPITFYGGKSLAVRTEATLEEWDDINSRAICIATGAEVTDASTTPQGQELGEALRQRGVSAVLLPKVSQRDAWLALEAGECDAMAGDRVELEVLRQRSSAPESYRVWQRVDQFYTDEPYAPLIRYGDQQWTNIVRWTILGLIRAEELGISSVTVTQLTRQPDDALPQEDFPLGTSMDIIQQANNERYTARVGLEVVRLLDADLGLGRLLGIRPDFLLAPIRDVGNYGEIYARNLGAGSRLPLERGINQLVINGGWIYAPSWQ